MKAVIFAGGLGTRLSEETALRPKPMVEIGGQPILWHIMKIYAHYGVDDFIICCGYKGEQINDYFANYFQRRSDVTFEYKHGRSQMLVHRPPREEWRVTLVDTGRETMTAGRLMRVKDYLKGEKDFCLTYGDGVSDVNISELIAFHRSHNKTATVTAIQPAGRFGALGLNGASVDEFIEKPMGDGNWINGGFFVLDANVFDYVPDQSDDIMWEADPMRNLAGSGQLQAFIHEGYWQAMDTLRERQLLETLYAENRAPWALWES